MKLEPAKAWFEDRPSEFGFGYWFVQWNNEGYGRLLNPGMYAPPFLDVVPIWIADMSLPMRQAFLAISELPPDWVANGVSKIPKKLEPTCEDIVKTYDFTFDSRYQGYRALEFAEDCEARFRRDMAYKQAWPLCCNKPRDLVKQVSYDFVKLVLRCQYRGDS